MNNSVTMIRIRFALATILQGAAVQALAREWTFAGVGVFWVLVLASVPVTSSLRPRERRPKPAWLDPKTTRGKVAMAQLAAVWVLLFAFLREMPDDLFESILRRPESLVAVFLLFAFTNLGACIEAEKRVGGP